MIRTLNWQIRWQLLFATKTIRKSLDETETNQAFDQWRYASYPPVEEGVTYFWTLKDEIRSRPKVIAKKDDGKDKPYETPRESSWSTFFSSWF